MLWVVLNNRGRNMGNSYSRMMDVDGSGCGHINMPHTELSARGALFSEKHVGQLRRYKKIATRDTKRGTQDRESVDTKSQWMLVIIVSTHPILHIPQGDLAC